LPLLAALIAVGRAQHCAPIDESYLAQVALRHEQRDLRLHVEYAKSGGQRKDAYQAYVIAYLDRDASLVPAPAPKALLDTDKILVLHTQVIRRNESGTYDLDFAISEDDLAKKIIAHAKLGDADRSAPGGWGTYAPRIQLAVFVPFLEDAKYSVLEGLPKDKHECNYENARALLFQTLPYALRIHYGIVRATSQPEGTYRVLIRAVESQDAKPAPEKRAPEPTSGGK
jgi:hypothetical protein